MVVDGRHHLQRQRIAAVSTRSEYRIANRSTLFSQVVDDYIYYLTERDSIDKCHSWLQSTTFGTEYLSFKSSQAGGHVEGTLRDAGRRVARLKPSTLHIVFG